jgi:FKBP-type peptidyl-prolyl cis-trans isomerase FkpA
VRFLLVFVAGVALAQTTSTGSQAAKPQSATPKSSTAARTSTKPAARPLVPLTDEQKTIYALGLSFYRSIGQFDLSPTEVTLIEKAISDAAAGKPAIDINEWGPKIQALAQARAARVSEREKTESAAYLEKAANQPGALKTPSGLIYREITAGTGPSPKPTDTVRVQYRGTLVDGTEFDSSYKRNEPAEFALNRVIPCWTEGLQRMKVGGKATLVCPASLAYGEQGRPGIPGNAALTFEIELLDIPAPTGK